MKLIYFFLFWALSAYGSHQDNLEISAQVSGECALDLAQDFFEIDLENQAPSVAVAVVSASNFINGYSLQFDFLNNLNLVNNNQRVALSRVYFDTVQVTDHLILSKTHAPNLGIPDLSYLKFHFASHPEVKLLQGKYSEIVTITCLAN